MVITLSAVESDPHGAREHALTTFLLLHIQRAHHRHLELQVMYCTYTLPHLLVHHLEMKMPSWKHQSRKRHSCDAKGCLSSQAVHCLFVACARMLQAASAARIFPLDRFVCESNIDLQHPAQTIQSCNISSLALLRNTLRDLDQEFLVTKRESYGLRVGCGRKPVLRS